VRGLEYYTGPVYEVELTLETKDEKGRPCASARSAAVAATTARLALSRRAGAGDRVFHRRVAAAGRADDARQARHAAGVRPVVVTVFDRDRVADYQKMVAQLRNANIRAELYLGNPKNMGNQLKYADRRNSPCVIIQGSDEKARGEVQIKDLIEGAKAAAAIASNQEWRETVRRNFPARRRDRRQGARSAGAP
jgi:histidyl-tRNA synthetase